MNRSLRFGRSYLQDILSCYSFYQGTIDSFLPIQAKNKNINARISIGENAWVLKRHRRDHRLKNLELSHWFQLQLRESAYPIASLVPTSENETTVAMNGEVYSVHEWVDGKQVNYPKEDPSLRAIESLAVNLAKLHRFGRELYKQHPGRSQNRSLLLAPAHYVGRINRSTKWRMSRLQLLKLKPHKSSYDLWVLGTFRKLAPRAQQLSRLEGSYFSDPCYIHNDIYWGNLIFDVDDNLIAFIDFEKSEVNSWEYEVGCAAAICATRTENVQTFLHAYEKESGAKLDVRLILLAMMTKIVRSSLWCVHAHLNRSVDNQEWLEGWSYHLDRCMAGVEGFMSQ